ncbi:MAG: energy-coupling factor ABC transporter permease, partial [Porphyromonadaceae bacterium]|nr:energy-coupling factor ABC transporter permease [Porphyromonadaceae bacterium]
MLRRVYLLALAAVLGLQPASAMHIMEGFLPLRWCLLWLLISLPFVLLSYRYVARQIKAAPRMRSTFALSA